MKCRMCNTEIEQGKSGYEIGLAKWHNNILPFPFIALICSKHYREIIDILGYYPDEFQCVEDQKDTKTN